MENLDLIIVLNITVLIHYILITLSFTEILILLKVIKKLRIEKAVYGN